MRKILCIPLACLLAAGCASVKDQAIYTFAGYDAKVDRYIERNPNRPAEIKGGLRIKALVKGMNAFEAKLCLGSPTETERVNDESGIIETWSYTERSSDEVEYRRFDVPIATLTFTNSPGGLMLSEWVIYKSGARGTLASARSSTDRERKQAPAAPVSNVKWPSLRLDRVVVNKQGISAVINDQTVKEGQVIEGATVSSIRSSGVLVKYQGETRLLKREK